MRFARGPLTSSLVIDGLPPIARGSTKLAHDNEIQLMKFFPKAAFFIEKPLSNASIEEVEKVKEALVGRVVSVGYMLRYLKGKHPSRRTVRKLAPAYDAYPLIIKVCSESSELLDILGQDSRFILTFQRNHR
jgi:hypothetical protein